MAPADAKLDDLSKKTAECVSRHDQVAKKLLELADELDEEERSMDMAKMGFSGSGAVGGGLAILGFGLSFVTFGVSLILTAVGAGISAVSGAGGLATTIAEKIVENRKVKEAKQAVQEYSDSIKSFGPVLESFCQLLTEEDQNKVWKWLQQDVEMELELSGVVSDGRKCVETFLNIRTLMSAARGAREAVESLQGEGSVAARAASVGSDVAKGGDEAFRALSTGAKVVEIGGVALAGVGVVIDVGSIIYYGIKIHRKRPSEIAQLIRHLAKSLET